MPEAREAVATRLRRQAAWCAALGSPLYEALLEASASDVIDRGPAWLVLEPFAGEPGATALSLRLMGAVHRLVLLDDLPGLALHYPSTGGDGDAAAAWPLFRKALAERRDQIQQLVARGCQTNEVGRTAALLGGFLEVAHRSGKPLRILEIGASAGLNLRWDRYRYESGALGWGDSASPVRFQHAFEVPPPLDRDAVVVERSGCDVNPIDPTTDEGALTLRSFVWADQIGRLALLDGAIELARDMPVEVQRLGGAEFLERELGDAREDVATVVYHSVVMQYVDEAERTRIGRLINAARVFHLEMEPGTQTFEIRLDGEVLGTTHAHGTGVRWNVDSS